MSPGRDYAFSKLFNFMERPERNILWDHPFKTKEDFENRQSITELEGEEKRQRALQLWAIGIRKAKVMSIVGMTFISVDNDVKIFGVTKNINLKGQAADENMEGYKCCFFIHPLGIFSKIWALIITCTLMISGLTIPYSTAFEVNFFSINLCMDLIFVLDVFLGFFSGYVRKDA